MAGVSVGGRFYVLNMYGVDLMKYCRSVGVLTG